MKNIVARGTLRSFWDENPDAEQALKTWYQVVGAANWKNSNDVKSQYLNASVVGDSRVVFNICGNKYRLIVKFNYQMQWCWIRFIGTHKAYDKIDTATI